MSTPLKGYDPTFHLQINGEALWKWRVIKSPDEMFETLQFNLYQIGYQLSSSCRKRVGLNVYSRMHYIMKKIRNANGKKCRDAARAQYWCTIMLHPDELSQAPADVIADLKETEEELVRENQRLKKELEGKNNKCPIMYCLRRGARVISASEAIAEIELKSISAIAVASIAGEWFPYDRYDRTDRTEVYLGDRWRVVSI